MTTSHTPDFSGSFDDFDEAQELAAGYVLGDLDGGELQLFEQQLRRDPALRAMVGELQMSFGLLAQSSPLQSAPIGLGDRVLAAFEQSLAGPVDRTADQKSDQKSVELAVNPAAASSHPGATSVSQPAPRPASRLGIWQGLMATIGLVAIAGLGLDNWRLRLALGTAETKVQVAQQMESAGGVLQRPTSKLVSLKASGSEAAGTMIFTPGKWQRVVVALGNLPPLEPDQIYRMWLQLADGQVLPCGEFVPNAAGGVFVTLSPSKLPPKGVKAKGVLVTIEAPTAPLTPTGRTVLTGSI